MKESVSRKILRIGLAITFIWVGVLIFQDPIYWSGFLPSWIIEFSPLDASLIMLSIAVLDLIVGVLLLINVWVHVAALFASAHLLGILIFTGIDEITVRDIGLLGASLALFLDSMPEKWKVWQKK